MFLYIAFIASLVGADASGLDSAHRMPAAMDVKKIVKYAHEHRAEATAPHARNLRDMVKPHDMVYHFFRDDACTIPGIKAVRHGNTCYTNIDDVDGSSSMAKVGCVVDSATGYISFQYVDYAQSPDCAGEPVSSNIVALSEMFASAGDVSAGDCVDMGEGEYAKLECSGKDPLRNALGFHMLNFEHGQIKHCKDYGIKTNTAMAHNFLSAGECISIEPGTSIMPEACGGPNEAMFREDPNSETCANLGEIQTHKFEVGCSEDKDDNGNVYGFFKEFCVDASTGPQMGGPA